MNKMRLPQRITWSTLLFGLSLSMAACTTVDSNDASDTSTSLPAATAGSSDSLASDPNETEGNSAIGGAVPDTTTGVSSQGEPSSDVQVVLADDEGISEESAEEPIEPAEAIVDPEDEVEAAQAKVGVSESALCATLQIMRDAVADGNIDLANKQRDLLAERASSIDDSELATVVGKLKADQPIDLSIADDGLRRCQVLGFEL